VPDALRRAIKRIKEAHDVVRVKLVRPVPDGHREDCRRGGPWFAHVRALLGAVEDKVPEHSEADTVPDGRQVDFGKFEGGRKLEEELPDAVEEEKKDGALEDKYQRKYEIILTPSSAIYNKLFLSISRNL